ncbi:cation-translocating P-type ATPase [Bdellovibrio sp. BCCA]|uniref:cation-translocating P-type ATPase n=1 Tax=Bdellovibrio sp. BCCA TaxID=3136281 RepID=UPI0030F1D991
MDLQGLHPEEARRRLKENGPNDIPSSKTRGALHLALEILREPMTVLLAVCGILYSFIGEQQDAFMLLGFWGLIVLITFYQERKTEKALEALRDLSSPRALVIRGGSAIRVPARELVVGDLLQLTAGDIVPADVLLDEVFQMQIDESLLTGEAFPVVKSAGDTAWSGTIAVQGQALATVTSTGISTRLGQIGTLLKSGRREKTPLKKETQTVVKRLTVVAIFLSFLITIVYFILNRDLLNGILVGLTLAMAILPNEIPAVLTIFLALGTRRLSKRNVLTRKITAVESIGATTTLCVDKTGTLTMNKMTVQRVLLSRDVQVSEKELLQVASLASNVKTYDPMEEAIIEAYGEDTKEHSPFIQFPLSPELFAMSNLWRREKNSSELIIASKGAPEAILKMCQLSPQHSEAVLKIVDGLASEGLRLLAVARGLCDEKDVPKDQVNLPVDFLGLLGFADPVRPGVKESIKECYDAGIRVIMITGDHAKTAASIAAQIGLKSSQKILTGVEMEKMSDSELSAHLKSATCFSRMLPEQKLRIVKILQGQGEVVAMTGDGVNDAPALAAAQIGIAMGKKGTDVAREASSIVLLDDDFTTIVQGIRIGRGIYDNLQSAMSYLIAVHIPIAGISILPVLLNLPIILMPVHVAFLHLLIEPTCSLVFEAEPAAENLMRRNPRNKDQPIFSKSVILPSVYQGLVIYVVIFVVFWMALRYGEGELDARALAFTILIFANLALIFINRSWARGAGWRISIQNKYLWPILMSTITILLVVLYIPAMRSLFHFSVLHPNDLLVSLLAAVVSVLWFEIVRRVKNWNRHIHF